MRAYSTVVTKPLMTTVSKQITPAISALEEECRALQWANDQADSLKVHGGRPCRSLARVLRPGQLDWGGKEGAHPGKWLSR